MRKTAALFLMITMMGPALPGTTLADDTAANDQAASFASRWPQTPMREPTRRELVRLVAGVAKAEIAPALTQIAARPSRQTHCGGDFCDLLLPR